MLDSVFFLFLVLLFSMDLLLYLQKKFGVTRREFFDMIKNQAVLINNATVKDSKATIAVGDTLLIKLENGDVFEQTIKQLPRTIPTIVLYYKPKGLVVSKDDPHNKTIFTQLPASRKKDFYPIGRLDKDSHGLLLLTNMPELVDYYENPRSKIHKVYEVVIDKQLTSHHAEKMKKGINVTESWIRITDINRFQTNNKQNDTYEQYDNLKAINVTKVSSKPQPLIRISLDEGKKRHIRRMLKALGYKVLDLKRIRVGKRVIGSLKPWSYKIERIKTHHHNHRKIR